MQTRQVQEHFRAQVTDYPALMRRLIPFYDAQRDVMLDLMPLDRSLALHVLDLGCGPGLMAERLLATFPEADLTLVDLTPEMIQECVSRLSGTGRVHCRVGDFRTDDFGEGYDVILASLSLHHLELAERSVFARRALRALAPGGRLVSAEVIVDESPDVREAQYAGWRRFMTAQGEDAEAWCRKHLAKDHPVQITWWLHLLAEAGFVSAGCFWRCLNFAIFSASKAGG